MAYQQRASGGYRQRASFPITTALVQDLNTICEATGLTMAQVCVRACEVLAQRYVIQGHFTREPRPFLGTEFAREAAQPPQAKQPPAGQGTGGGRGVEHGA